MAKKLFPILIVVLALGLALALPVAAQDAPKWDGGDDLPTNPLDCPMAEGAAAPEPTEEAMMEMLCL
ncbi:MAG: hypothetical protein R3E39_24780 [Anaerolineae bacterium]